MKPVKSLPRFQCDFCKKRSIESCMRKHEIRCFQNPNRLCGKCANKGEIMEIENAVERFKNVLRGGRLDDIPEKKHLVPCPDCARMTSNNQK